MQMNMIAGHGKTVLTDSTDSTNTTSEQAPKGQEGTSFAGLLVQVLGGGAPKEGTSMLSAVALLSQLTSTSAQQDGQELPAEWQELQKQLATLLSGEQTELQSLMEANPELTSLLGSLLMLLQNTASTTPTKVGVSSEATMTMLASQTTLASEAAKQIQSLVQTMQNPANSDQTNAIAQELQKQLAPIVKLLNDQMNPSGQTTLTGEADALTDELQAKTAAWQSTPLHLVRKETKLVVETGSVNGSTSQAGPQVQTQANLAMMNKPVYSFQMMQSLTETVAGGESQMSAPTIDASTTPTLLSTDTGTTMRSLATDLAVKSAPVAMQADQFAAEMSEMVMKNLKILTGNGFSEARITLIPEQLGQVDVKLTMQNGQLVAQFMTDSLAGKEALEGQLNQLRAALQTQGVQVEKLVVSHSEFAGLAHQFQEQRNQHFGRQSEQQNKGKGEEVSALDFDQELEQTGYTPRWSASSFEVTA